MATRQRGVEAAKGQSEFDQGLAMAYYDVLTIAIEEVIRPAMGKQAEALLDNLVERANRFKTSGAGGPALLSALWSTPANYKTHLFRRQKAGHVQSGEDYAIKTFLVLAQSTKMLLASPTNERLATGKFQLQTADWAVLVSENGSIVTSYPVDPKKPTFETKHRAVGDRIDEYAIGERHRAELARIFTRD